MLDDPTPLDTSGGGCGSAAPGTAGRWCRCDGTPEYAGEWTFIYPRRHTATIYVCREHRHMLPETRPINGEERAELKRRREAEQRLLDAAPKPPPALRWS